MMKAHIAQTIVADIKERGAALQSQRSAAPATPSSLWLKSK